MKESEIRPQELFDRYLELSRQDVEEFFSDHSDFVQIPCPACTSTEFGLGLTKSGFEYVTCLSCGTLYLSPRPTDAMISAYQRESKATEYFGTHFFKETEAARREQMFKPRAQLVNEWTSKLGLEEPLEFVDIGSGYGIFLEEIANLNRYGSVTGIEPAPTLAAICRKKGFTIIEKCAEELTKGELGASFATSFEVLEHVFDPLTFLTGIRRALRKGGLLLFTTLTITGFDIQVLWEKSKSVNPPQHINFISVSGMEKLVERAGFDVVEVSTPGQLDVDIVANMAKENSDIELPRFVKQLVEEVSDEAREAFQKFLQDNRLSSHIRVIAQAR